MGPASAAAKRLPPAATRLLLSITPLDVAIKTALSFLLVAAVFFVLWLVAPAPATTSKDRTMRASWALKAVSVVHAVIVAGAAIWALLYEPSMRTITAGVLQRDAEAVQGPLIHARSDVVAMVAPLTLAYFVFDLLLVPVWEGKMTQHIPVFLHHGLSLLTWPVGVCHPACHWFLLCCLSMEFSTPLVQMRWFVSQHPSLGKAHPVYLVNGVLMTLCFVVCRLYPMLPHNTYAIWVAAPHAADLPLTVRVAASCLILPNVLNLYWGWLMAKGLLGVLFPSLKGSKKAGGQEKKVAFVVPPAAPPSSSSSSSSSKEKKTLKAA